MEYRFKASDGQLHRVLDTVEKFLEKNDCTMKAKLQIVVAVEEIFVNIAHYAYGGAEGDMALEMAVADGKATFCFRDHGMPFDPLKRPDPDITLAAEDRDEGGLGIYLVKKTMDRMTYAFINGENVLTLEKKIG